MGDFWDKHGLSEFWNKTRKVKFDVVVEPEAIYYSIAKDLSRRSSRRHANRAFPRGEHA
jgi:hypothetical protein